MQPARAALLLLALACCAGARQRFYGRLQGAPGQQAVQLLPRTRCECALRVVTHARRRRRCAGRARRKLPTPPPPPAFPARSAPVSHPGAARAQSAARPVQQLDVATLLNATHVPIVRFPSLAPTVLELLKLDNVRGDMVQNISKPLRLSELMPKLPVIPTFSAPGAGCRRFSAGGGERGGGLARARQQRCLALPRGPHAGWRSRGSGLTLRRGGPPARRPCLPTRPLPLPTPQTLAPTRPTPRSRAT
jgi:hypothetical protein